MVQSQAERRKKEKNSMKVNKKHKFNISFYLKLQKFSKFWGFASLTPHFLLYYPVTLDFHPQRSPIAGEGHHFHGSDRAHSCSPLFRFDLKYFDLTNHINVHEILN